MKFGKIIYMCHYDILAKKKQSLRLVANMICIFTLLFSWLVLSYSLKNSNNDLIYGCASLNYLPFDWMLPCGDAEIDAEAENCRKWLEAGTQMDECGEYVLYSPINIPEVLNQDRWLFANIKYMELEYDGKVYQGNNDYDYYFERPYSPENSPATYSVPFRVNVCFSDIFYTENDLVEYRYTYKDSYKNAMIYGSERLGPNELIVTDYMLDKFGIPFEEYQGLIGKNISIGYEGNNVIDEAVLVGIADSRLMKSKNLWNTQVFLGASDEIAETYGLTEMNARLPFDRFEDSFKIMDRLTEMGMPDQVYTRFNLEQYDFVATGQVIVNKIVSFYAIFIVLALVIDLYNVFLRDMEERNGYHGMLRSIGMSRSTLWKYIGLKMMELSMVALGIAFGASMLILRVMNNLLRDSIGIPLALKFDQTVSILGTGILMAIMLIILLEIPIAIRIGRKQPGELLKSTLFH